MDHHLETLVDLPKERSQSGGHQPPANSTLDVVRETRPHRPNRANWLVTSGRPNVFIAFLAGAGVLLSAGAWIIDRLASHTTTRAGEARLTRRLGPIGYPPGGLLEDDMTIPAQAVPGCDDAQLRALLRRSRPRG